ncbi:hypothetical protein GS597_09065 [Synechococcales cyanobacterium C]|uniref:Uncharacterized protein n=1 Tax=Petrachloros mirabilis ULC683 TaxID=2781853 RepID=A0A8K1ZZN3_9CYAN|nr:hypothetical protein [Petrachloros mirabilis]NCJ06652.1 hypothetical protein [Petrachloros mirabilis ULC683]
MPTQFFSPNPAEIPSYARVERPRGVVYAGAPRQYRFNGKDGCFYQGGELVDQELQIQPFEVRWDYGERWGRPAQSWLDVAFADAGSVISIISFKKDSALNLFEAFLALHEAGLVPDAVRLYLTSDLRETEDGGFWVVDIAGYEILPEQQYRDLLEFKESRRFEWILIGEAA